MAHHSAGIQQNSVVCVAIKGGIIHIQTGIGTLKANGDITFIIATAANPGEERICQHDMTVKGNQTVIVRVGYLVTQGYYYRVEGVPL